MRDTKNDELLDDLDLLSDEDETEHDPWPRNTAFIELDGKRYRLHAELVEADNHDPFRTVDELYWWIVNREPFRPRNAAEDWLDEYLVNADTDGVLRSEAFTAAAEAGFSTKTIERAFTGIEAHSHRQGMRQPARWYRHQSLCSKLH